GHGLAFVYFEFSSGIDVIEVEFESTYSLFDLLGNNLYLANPTLIDTIGVEISKTNAKNYYGFFTDEQSVFQISGNVLSIKLPADTSKKYLSCAIMTKRDDLSFFYNYAYAFVVDTKVSWQYDEKKSEIITKFEVETISKRYNQQKTLLIIFPHQWKNVVEPINFVQKYNTLRGEMKLMEGNVFHTKLKFNGILPFLPDCGEYDRNHLLELLQNEKDTLLLGPGQDDDNTYSTAKRLAKVANMIPIADSIEAKDIRDYLISRLKDALINWYTYNPGELECFFYYDKNWMGLIGYNSAFTSENFTDHHFHYGYFIYASAILGMYDKDFVKNYGGMIEILIRDIASPYRDDPMFPFLRCMDPYEGHSWADGFSKFYDGNNQESTSEAMNAWAGIILWGLVTGNTTYRDLGIWGYVTEYSATREYWFDIDKDLFSKYPSYNHHMASLVWGGKVDHLTWFSSQPECIHGIQYIPVVASSLYLTYDIEWAKDDYNEMITENGGLENENGWHSIIWKFQAMFDPISVISKYQENDIYLNDGDTWSHVYHWIHNFNSLGAVSTDIYADYTAFNVFIKDGVRTFVAYNFEDQPKYINFYERATNKYLGSMLVEPYKMVWTKNLEFKDEPPEIISFNLQEGTTISDIINIEANIRDDFGIFKIELFLDEIKIDEWQGTVSSLTYVYNLNTTLYNDGIHRIKIIVKDTSQQDTSLELNVYINNISLSDETEEDEGDKENEFFEKDFSFRNYPNPFKIGQYTEIRFMTDKKYDDIKLQIYDPSGKLINHLQVIETSNNRYISYWYGDDIAKEIVKPGMYICQLQYGKKKYYRKIIAVK
ncbi:MAG: glycosyl hydrolase, partial [candidate division WOR-3 bacterium]